jgi:D-galactarolactone cycloisomerase
MECAANCTIEQGRNSRPVQRSHLVFEGFMRLPRRSVLLLRIEDDDGAYGWGEVWFNFPPFSADNKVRLIETIVAPAAFSEAYDSPSHAWHNQ